MGSQKIPPADVPLSVLTVSSGLLASSTTLARRRDRRVIGGAAHAIMFTSVYRLVLAIVPIHRRGRSASTVAIGNGAALAVGVPLPRPASRQPVSAASSSATVPPAWQLCCSLPRSPTGELAR